MGLGDVGEHFGSKLGRSGPLGAGEVDVVETELFTVDTTIIDSSYTMHNVIIIKLTYV